ELFANIIPAQARQHDVEHHERRLVLVESVERLVAAPAQCDLERLALQNFLQTKRDVGIVFDNQNFRFHVSARIGRRKTKQLPPPGRVWQATSPPCVRAICRASVRPSPDPWMPLLNE